MYPRLPDPWLVLAVGLLIAALVLDIWSLTR
jgi:hypothetical protein